MKQDKRQRLAFDTYYIMPKRSMQKCAKIVGVTRTTIERWAKKFKWNNKIKIRDFKISKKTEKKVIEKISDIDADHIRMYQDVQKKGVVALEGTDIEDGADATKVIDTGIKGEREVRGLRKFVITIEDVQHIVQKIVIVINKNVKDTKLRDSITRGIGEILRNPDTRQNSSKEGSRFA